MTRYGSVVTSLKTPRLVSKSEMSLDMKIEPEQTESFVSGFHIINTCNISVESLFFVAFSLRTSGSIQKAAGITVHDLNKTNQPK